MAAVYEAFEEELDEEAQAKPFNYGYFRRMLRYLGPYKRQLAWWAYSYCSAPSPTWPSRCSSRPSSIGA